MTKVFIPDPSYKITNYDWWDKKRPWFLTKVTKNHEFKGKFRTKKEANRSIPLIKYS